MENTTYTDQTETDRAPFVITDEGGANWLLSKLANLDAEAERIKANTARRVAELQIDRAALLFQFGGQLEVFARAEADRRRRKTVTLANGVVSFRAVPERFAITDRAAALDAAKTAYPEAVQAVPTLNAAALLDYVKRTGDVLPGIELQPASESVSIKPGAKE